MKVMHLEIDSRMKERLINKLSATEMLGLSFHAESDKPAMNAESGDEMYEGQDVEKYRLGVEIFAELESVGRITKTLVRLAREEISSTLPIKLVAIRTL